MFAAYPICSDYVPASTSKSSETIRPCFARQTCGCCREAPKEICMRVAFAGDWVRDTLCPFRPRHTVVYQDCKWPETYWNGEGVFLQFQRLTSPWIEYNRESWCILLVSWPDMGWTGKHCLRLPLPDNDCCFDEKWTWTVDLSKFSGCCPSNGGRLVMHATTTPAKTDRCVYPPTCWGFPPATGLLAQDDAPNRDAAWKAGGRAAYIITNDAYVKDPALRDNASPFSHWITLAEDGLMVDQEEGVYEFICNFQALPSIDVDLLGLEGRFAVVGELISVSLNGFPVPAIPLGIEDIDRLPDDATCEDVESLSANWHYFRVPPDAFVVSGTSPPIIFYDYNNSLVFRILKKAYGRCPQVGPVGLRVEFSCPQRPGKASLPIDLSVINEPCLPPPPNTGAQVSPYDPCLDANWTVNGKPSVLYRNVSPDYLGDDVSSHWITIDLQGGCAKPFVPPGGDWNLPVDVPEGNYTFSTSWSITASNADAFERVVFGGRLAVYGELIDFSVNGRKMPVEMLLPDGAFCESSMYPSLSWTYFAFCGETVARLFQTGTNTVSLTVRRRRFDCAELGPVALRVEFYCCPASVEAAPCCVLPPATGQYVVRALGATPSTVPTVSSLPYQRIKGGDGIVEGVTVDELYHVQVDCAQCAIDYYWTCNGGPAWVHLDDRILRETGHPMGFCVGPVCVNHPQKECLDKNINMPVWPQQTLDDNSSLVIYDTYRLDWYVDPRHIGRIGSSYIYMFYDSVYSNASPISVKLNGVEMLDEPRTHPPYPPLCNPMCVPGAVPSVWDPEDCALDLDTNDYVGPATPIFGWHYKHYTFRLPVSLLHGGVNTIEIVNSPCHADPGCFGHCPGTGVHGLCVSFSCCANGPRYPLIDDVIATNPFGSGVAMLGVPVAPGECPYSYDVHFNFPIDGTTGAGYPGPILSLTPNPPVYTISGNQGGCKLPYYCEGSGSKVWEINDSFWIYHRPQDLMLFFMTVDMYLGSGWYDSSARWAPRYRPEEIVVNGKSLPGDCSCITGLKAGLNTVTYRFNVPCGQAPSVYLYPLLMFKDCLYRLDASTGTWQVQMGQLYPPRVCPDPETDCYSYGDLDDEAPIPDCPPVNEQMGCHYYDVSNILRNSPRVRICDAS